MQLPEAGWMVGYAALIDHFGLSVPIPPAIALVTERFDPDDHEGFITLGRPRLPHPTFEGHIELALKEEGVRLDVLSALAKAIPPAIITEYVQSEPTGKYARRVWFFFEWLTGEQLEIADIEGRPRAVLAIDPEMQVALPNGALSRRHRVRNNVPGTPGFCPLIWRTDSIRKHESASYDEVAREQIGATHPDLITRAAAFLLLADSRSSFEIEGERPSGDRTRRWGQAIAEAGRHKLDLDQLLRLQAIVIGDARFVELGLRSEDGFVGARDRITRDPIPEHISARPGDLTDLLEGLVEFESRARSGDIDAVHVAACVAFGFIYIHPFQDGNGRIHRWLIHYVLSMAGYNPPGVPFPVSASILRNIEQYRNVLRSYSERLLPLIDWTTTDRRNIRVRNETADYYRFFDATRHAEFLFDCVCETVATDLPAEVAFLQAYDRFERDVQQIIDMPDDSIDLLFRFLEQNDGVLSKRARTREFSELTDEERALIEDIYAAIDGSI